MSTTDSVFIDIDKRILFLSDDINNEAISKISFNILSIIQKDDEEEKIKKRICA